jgi:DNA-directed RNA polymerase III subunit RPC4
MTASGPFAMGPALAGTSARRSTPRSNFSPIVPKGTGSSSAVGMGLSSSVVPSLKRETDIELSAPGTAGREDDVDVYSDPEDGVEIIDMENIRQMDWMAPESLRRERNQTGRKKQRPKRESPAKSADYKGKGKGQFSYLL